MAKKTTRQRKTSRKKSPRKQNRTLFWAAIGLGVVLILILAGIGYASTRSKTSTTSAFIDETIGQPIDRTSIGDPDAPVVVETYEDFLCPHCAEFTRDLGPVLKDLVKEGKVRWVFKYRVIGGADSYNANMAAECAADQGKFWPYHEELFRRISEQGKIAVYPQGLKQLAADLGLDTQAFNQCFDSKTHLKDIQKIDQLAAARGVNGTPTIFINGQKYTGPRTPEAFRAAIEAAGGSNQ